MMTLEDGQSDRGDRDTVCFVAANANRSMSRLAMEQSIPGERAKDKRRQSRGIADCMVGVQVTV
jgi:hypothetical protein